MDKDHVHVFLGCPPKSSIVQVVGALKAISAREIQAGFPEVRQLYCVRTVADTMRADVIKKHIRFHEAKKRGAEQLMSRCDCNNLSRSKSRLICQKPSAHASRRFHSPALIIRSLPCVSNSVFKI